MGRRPPLPQPARPTHFLPKVMQASGTDSRSAERFAASAARAQYLLKLYRTMSARRECSGHEFFRSMGEAVWNLWTGS